MLLLIGQLGKWQETEAEKGDNMLQTLAKSGIKPPTQPYCTRGTRSTNELQRAPTLKVFTSW